MAAAQAQGSRVEVLDALAETSVLYRRPDKDHRLGEAVWLCRWRPHSERVSDPAGLIDPGKRTLEVG